jgi:hypothetical protein
VTARAEVEYIRLRPSTPRLCPFLLKLYPPIGPAVFIREVGKGQHHDKVPIRQRRTLSESTSTSISFTRRGLGTAKPAPKMVRDGDLIGSHWNLQSTRCPPHDSSPERRQPRKAPAPKGARLVKGNRVHIPLQSKPAVADFDRLNWLAEMSLGKRGSARRGARWWSVLPGAEAPHRPVATDPCPQVERR